MAVVKNPAVNSPAIKKFLNKPAKQLASVPANGTSEYRQINIKLLDSEGSDIDMLREFRPKPRSGKRLGISLHDWIIEAIQEKIQREKLQYKEEISNLKKG